MKRYFSLLFKAIRFITINVKNKLDYITCRILLDGNNADYQRITTSGVPYVSVARNGKCVIGDHFAMNNNLRGNPIGRVHRCIFFVDNGAELIIGNNVGVSSAALVSRKSIRIGNYVKIGGGVCIYDTDFHSLDAEIRKEKTLDAGNVHHAAVVIGDNVFIGAHSTILKGVTVGDNAIIGACSVVTKSVPANEIWAGNPARFIKTVTIQSSIL